jgi:flagellar capping protein FliD
VANSTTVNGNTITVNDATGANGLQLLYTGTTDASNVQLNFTVGLGAQMFFSLGNMLDTTDGLIQADIKGLQDQNTQNQTRIDSMQSLLDQQKQDLTLKFNNLETALAQAQSIKDTLTQMFDAAFNQNKNN